MSEERIGQSRDHRPMTGHTIADVLTETSHTTVWCTCGHSYIHPDRQGALKRLETHLLIADTRARLKGDKRP